MVSVVGNSPGARGALVVLMLSGGVLPARAHQDDRTEPVAAIPAEQPQPADGRSWRARGDDLLEAGQLLEAIEAYRRAERLGAGDEELVMQIAQIYRRLGRDRDAYREFRRNRRARDAELRASACYGMNDLLWAKHKTLPNPYFTEIGAYGGWQSVDDLSYFAMPVRVGLLHGNTHPTASYLFAKVGGDSRTGWHGAMLQQYSDNLAVLGAGVQQLLFPAIGLKAVGELGWAHDLAQVDRSRSRSDVRAGLELWQEWYTARRCEGTTLYPLRFVMTAWGELMYYSRYDKATVLGGDLRPGVRLRESNLGAIDFLAVLGFNVDFKTNGFQYGEVGAALRWIPDHQNPFRIAVRAVQTYNHLGRTGMKYGIELEHYFYW